MRNRLMVIIALLLLGAISLSGCDSSGNEHNKIIDKAETYIDLLGQGDYEEATKDYDDTMRAELTPEALEELWETLLEQAGQFIDQEFDSVETADDHQVVLINGLFEATEVTFVVTFNQNEEIAGFFIQ